MIDLIFAMIAAGSSAGVASESQSATASPAARSPSVSVGENVQTGAGVVIGGTVATPKPAAPPLAPAAQPSFDMSVVPAGLVAEPQAPSGKFTTAAEIKPILNATKGNWVAVRAYNGQDLLYVTHLWGWRCGLKAIAISVNGEAMQNWPMPPCHTEFATPNAVLEDDGLPYLALTEGGVQQIDIQIVYDDLSMDRAQFARGDVLIP